MTRSNFHIAISNARWIGFNVTVCASLHCFIFVSMWLFYNVVAAQRICYVFASNKQSSCIFIEAASLWLAKSLVWREAIVDAVSLRIFQGSVVPKYLDRVLVAHSVSVQCSCLSFARRTPWACVCVVRVIFKINVMSYVQATKCFVLEVNRWLCWFYINGHHFDRWNGRCRSYWNCRCRCDDDY